jgi:hypothetical protein
VRKILFALLALLLVGAAPAHATIESKFPRVRIGIGDEPTAGGGVIAGDNFVARSAVIVWNSKWNNLRLYIFPRTGVTCSKLIRAVQKPGHVIQVFVTNQRHVAVEQPVTDPQVGFMTIFRNPKIPMHISGLKHGASLEFSRVDSYPGGVWHGTFKVPQRIYGNGRLYGYNGTFAAKFCQLHR